MKYVFWQNMLSIHQAPFLRALSQSHDVCLVVSHAIEERRLKVGWSIPDFGQTDIVIEPDLDKMNMMLANKDTIHVFSGINLSKYPLMRKAFNLGIKQNAKIGIMSEPFNISGMKGKIRTVKYMHLSAKYNNKLSFILTTGKEGRRCYERTCFSKEKIFDWGYFTEKVSGNTNRDVIELKEKINLIFIGSIDKRKNVLSLIESFISVDNSSARLIVIGNGALEQELKTKIKNSPNIDFLGRVDNNNISDYISASDLLILPSVFDGWGAVVNEALMCGTPVVASDYCGASVLLDGKQRGEIFSVKKDNLSTILDKWIKKGKVSDKQRAKIKHWSEENISGEVSSHYFLEIMTSVFEKGERPIAPWVKNKFNI